MRFSPKVEAAFLDSRRNIMFLNFSRLAMLAVVALSMDSDYSHSMWGNWSEASNTMRAGFVCKNSFLMIGLVCAVLPRLECFQMRVSFFAMEVASTLVMMMLLVYTIAFNPVIVNYLYSTPTEENDTHVAASSAVAVTSLTLDAVVTCAHCALPVRWCIMVWLDVAFVAMHTLFAYTAFTALSDLDADSTYVIVVFAVLAAGACLGLRTIESRDRALFITIADERTLRAQAEFASNEYAVSRGVSDPSVSHQSINQQSHLSSEAASLFRQAGNHDETALAELRDLGVKEQWLIDKDELHIFQDQVMGAGGHGVVVAGSFCSSPVAIKCVSERKRSKDSEGATKHTVTALNELRIMRRIRHPNIVLLYGACMDPVSGDLMLVLERLQGSPLGDFISSLAVWRETSPCGSQQVSIMLDLCRALIYLHSRQPCIVHADLKPDNLMVEFRDSEPFLKLLDFGLSRRVTRNATLHGGTVQYMAPEIIREESYKPRPSADIYSLGLMLFFVASGRKPRAGFKRNKIVKLCTAGKEPPLIWHPSTALLEKQRPLVQMCTVFDQNLRPSVQQVHDRLLNDTLSSNKDTGAGTSSLHLSL